MRSLIRRHLWTRLPRQARCPMLFKFSSLAAASPTADAQPCEPIIVVGCLRSATGLGESARLCYRALQMGGFDVWAVDVSSLLMQPLDVGDFCFRDGHSLRGP